MFLGFFFPAGCSFGMGVFVYLLLPETKGIPIDQVTTESKAYLSPETQRKFKFS